VYPFLRKEEEMITLKGYSYWNGYPTLKDAIDCGALYTISGPFDADHSSYTPIADVMEASDATCRVIGVEPLSFVLEKDGRKVEVRQGLNVALMELLDYTENKND
jgi:hypothetical protein